MTDASWNSVKFSLERPYKDDNGDRIPILYDITSEGQLVHEPKEDPTQTLAEKLRRIFVERGVDFFDQNPGEISRTTTFVSGTVPADQADEGTLDSSPESDSEDSEKNRYMTPEELHQMRAEILPQLFIALGEMSHARDLLSMILSSQLGQQQSSNSLLPSQLIPALASSQPTTSVPLLSATMIAKPPEITSVRAFNAQLSVGGKDEALRKAASVFKQAAERMERGRLRSEQYWVDGLKIRRENWGLIPAPLPYGSATGKGADKTSKDFLVSFGLEESSPAFRRLAVGHMSTNEASDSTLTFPNQRSTVLRVSLVSTDSNGQKTRKFNTPSVFEEDTLDGRLRGAQREMIEYEVFSLLVQEAGKLPSASARVSERLIIIDAADNTELVFELVEKDIMAAESPDELYDHNCDLIYYCLEVLLLRRHEYLKTKRLGASGVQRLPGSQGVSTPPPILHPIIDIIQYQVFCSKVRTELEGMTGALQAFKVPTTLRFDAVAETATELVHMLSDGERTLIGGEANLRINNRYTIRFSFLSPSTLTVHLSQATLLISSIPQLSQLLADEVERCLLHRIRDIGTRISEPIGGTWFVDLNRCIGRWDGGVLNFQIVHGPNYSLDCSAFQLDRTTAKQGDTQHFSKRAHPTLTLLTWAEHIIHATLLRADS
ncbi:hypothetical protein BDN72DRAFT_785935 [Pluteus cervinus]|uniref:Uncharacterized protein n=1 Tax=Pluteus cervinus TaxID=181527 RepID=A0ACD3BCU4_9AGAR|nr:hypothetical protein BDN72DRAFT_785935 [Pluteus cervinus]